MTASRLRPRRLPLRAAAASVLAALAAGALAPTAGAATARSAAPAPSTASTATLTGTLVRAYVEAGRVERGKRLPDTTTAGADQLAWVRTASGERVRVPSNQVAEVPAGAGVRLAVGARRPGTDSAPTAGREVLSTTVTSTPPRTGSSSPTVAGAGRTAAAVRAAATSAAQQITLVQAVPARSNGTYQADTDVTTADLAGQVAKASAFWSRQTGGRITLKVVKAVGWTRLSATCADPDALWAEAAAKAGWTEAVGRHLVVELPEAADTGGCGAGLGTVGRFLGDGGTTWTSYADWAVIAHELGHNFSLGHANALNCGTAADRASGCTEQGYEDGYDVMGVSWWNTGSLSTAHLDELGLMTSSTQRDVTTAASASADLRPVGGHQGVQSMTFMDRGVRYWVEYRGALGYDAWTRTSTVNSGYTSGVLVRRGGYATSPSSAYYDSRVLLRPRGVPASGSTKPQWTLTAGQAMETASHRVIRVTSVSSTSAHVLVETNAPLASVRMTAHTSGQRVSGVAYHKASSLTVTFGVSPRSPRKGFEVLVDGKVRATASPTARSAKVTGLTSGSHTVAVRALDSSRSVTSPKTRIRVDRTAPTFRTAPTLRLRKGAVNPDVPLLLRYAASDGVRLTGLTATSPGKVLAPTSRSLSLTQRSGTTVTRKLTAKDAAGNTRTATSRAKVLLTSERKHTRYAGPWVRRQDKADLGGQAMRSRTRGAAVSLTTSSRDVGLIALTGPTQGRVRVYVDGRSTGTLDLHADRPSTRRVVWTKHFDRSGRHTVRLVVEGTSGHPWVSLDGWALLG